MYDMSFCTEFVFLFIFLNIQNVKNGIFDILFGVSNKKLKHPFVKVES